VAWLSLLGGLALFTYGFDLTAKGLRRIAARRLRRGLAPVARSRVWGALFGFLVTLLTGSSTATTMMMVGLVAAGALGLAQALNVILGAALGTTVVVQIIAFPLVQELAPALVLLGVLWRLFEKRKVIRGPGESVLGFGLTLYGLGVIFRSAELLAAEPGFRAGFLALARGNLAVFLGTTLFTALVANSATAIALGFSFARHGLLGPAAEAAACQLHGPIRGSEPPGWTSALRRVGPGPARPCRPPTRTPLRLRAPSPSPPAGRPARRLRPEAGRQVVE